MYANLLTKLIFYFSTFCIVDAKSMCVAVTVYNLADGKGVIIGDSVAIPEPYVTRHKFNFEEKVLNSFFIVFHYQLS